MVFFFTSNVVQPSGIIYMGLDKYENEDLIRWGWPEDIWFHVDKMSSAHVYIRMPKGKTIDDVSPELVNDCAQLVKANSIQGNKVNNVDVVYTSWSNLKKTGDMDVGQIGFFSKRAVKMVRLEKRVNEIVNRLNKTQVERMPDFREEREERDRCERELVKSIARNAKEVEKKQLDEQMKIKESRDYGLYMTSDNMTSNREACSDSDDFM